MTGFDSNTRMTWSNNFLNGETTHSAGCDDYHYWTMELVGAGDEITFQSKYITPCPPARWYQNLTKLGQTTMSTTPAGVDQPFPAQPSSTP